MEAPPHFKVVFLGDSGAGKTCVISRLTRDEFSERTDSTVGATFHKIVLCKNALEIWDCAGQERYASLAPMYLRGADAVVLAADATNAESLTSLRTKHAKAVSAACPNAQCMLLITKCDDLSSSSAGAAAFSDSDVETLRSALESEEKIHVATVARVTAKADNPENTAGGVQTVRRAFEVFSSTLKISRDLQASSSTATAKKEKRQEGVRKSHKKKQSYRPLSSSTNSSDSDVSSETELNDELRGRAHYQAPEQDKKKEKKSMWGFKKKSS